MSEKDVKQGKFVEVRGKMRARKGTKAPWIEIMVEKPGGEITRLIARKVDTFWSERQEQKSGKESLV